MKLRDHASSAFSAMQADESDAGRAQRAATAAEAFALGEAQYRAGAYRQSAALFERLSTEHPDDAASLRMLGLCRLRLGEVEPALALLFAAKALAPNDPFAMLHLGLGLHAAGRHAEAATQFRGAAPLLPLDPAPYLNLSSALLTLGDAPAALDAARRARRRAPRLPEASYTAGMALLALGRFEAAEQAFAAALREAPRFADAWVNIGIARYRQNDVEGAKEAMRQALAAAPEHAVAAANLAAFLRLTGNVEAGEALLRQVISKTPAAFEARLNLSVALLQEERATEALALLDEAPPPGEGRLARAWQMQRSLALLQLGLVSEAEAALAGLGEVPPDLMPLLAWRRALLALAVGDGAAARKHAEEMEQGLRRSPDLLPEHRIMGHFDLARFWSEQRQPSRAFPHWVDAHRLLGRFQPFSRDAHRAFVDALIATFDRARLAGGARASNCDEAPVFIVGMPRSGTTLAEQIIGAHKDAHAAGERSALMRAWHTLGGGETAAAVARIAGLDGATLDRAAASYLAELRALAPGATRIVDKMPGNFNYLGLAALLMPGARIVHCVRDPRDIGLSIFTFRFYGHHPYAHDLGDLGWYIAEHDRLMAHWRAALPNPLWTIALRDWVEDFAGTLRHVLEFLGLAYDPACERFYEQDTRVRTVSRAQVRQPVNARGLGRWRGYEDELQPLISALRAGGALPAH